MKKYLIYADNGWSQVQEYYRDADGFLIDSVGTLLIVQGDIATSAFAHKNWQSIDEVSDNGVPVKYEG